MEEYNIIVETDNGLLGVDNLLSLSNLLGVDICYYDIEDLLTRDKIGDYAAKVSVDYAAELHEEQKKFLKTDEVPRHYNRKGFIGNLKASPVKKYDRDGNLIIVFHSFSAAAQDLGKTPQALYKLMGKVGWWYREQYYYCLYNKGFVTPQKKIRAYRGENNSIQCIDPKDGKIIAEYPTIAEACRQTGMPRHRIDSLIKKDIEDDNGYFWYDLRATEI